MGHLWIAALTSAGHVLGIALAFASLGVRILALRAGNVERAERADNFWGLSALLVGGTGLARLFWLEKGSAFYLTQWSFHAKMGLFGLVLLLELWPMFLLIRWRIQRARGQPQTPIPTQRLAQISAVQWVLMLLMPVLGAAMARGLPLPG